MRGTAIAFVVAIALPLTGLVKSVFFPGENVDFIFAEIEKPEGTTLGATDIATRAVEEGFTKYTPNAGLTSLRQALCRKLACARKLHIHNRPCYSYDFPCLLHKINVYL